MSEYYIFSLNITCFLLIYLAYNLARKNDMFTQILYLSLFSLCSCIIYLFLDAPDVAMTEAAIGACVSTVIFTSLIKHFDLQNSPLKGVKNLFVIIICISLALSLIYASQNLFKFGDINSPVQTGVSSYYINNTLNEIGIPSFVAAILASYRGFDTLGETIVILTAGFGILFVLKKENISKENKQQNKKLNKKKDV